MVNTGHSEQATDALMIGLHTRGIYMIMKPNLTQHLLTTTSIPNTMKTIWRTPLLILGNGNKVVQITHPTLPSLRKIQYQDIHPPPYHTYLSNQQQMVARGPKIHFPEFDGTDPEGCIGNQRSILKWLMFQQRIEFDCNSCQARSQAHVCSAHYWLCFAEATLA